MLREERGQKEVLYQDLGEAVTFCILYVQLALLL